MAFIPFPQWHKILEFQLASLNVPHSLPCFSIKLFPPPPQPRGLTESQKTKLWDEGNFYFWGHPLHYSLCKSTWSTPMVVMGVPLFMPLKDIFTLLSIFRVQALQNLLPAGSGWRAGVCWPWTQMNLTATCLPSGTPSSVLNSSLIGKSQLALPHSLPVLTKPRWITCWATFLKIRFTELATEWLSGPKNLFWKP